MLMYTLRAWRVVRVLHTPNPRPDFTDNPSSLQFGTSHDWIHWLYRERVPPSLCTSSASMPSMPILMNRNRPSLWQRPLTWGLPHVSCSLPFLNPFCCTALPKLLAIRSGTGPTLIAGYRHYFLLYRSYWQASGWRSCITLFINVLVSYYSDMLLCTLSGIIDISLLSIFMIIHLEILLILQCMCFTWQKCFK